MRNKRYDYLKIFLIEFRLDEIKMILTATSQFLKKIIRTNFLNEVTCKILKSNQI